MKESPNMRKLKLQCRELGQQRRDAEAKSEALQKAYETLSELLEEANTEIDALRDELKCAS